LIALPTLSRTNGTGQLADAQALFAEARRRRRRIRLTAGLIAVGLAASAAVLLANWPHHSGAPGRPDASAAALSAVKLPAVLVAWVDYNGRLHIGSLITGQQRVAAAANSDPVVPLIAAGDHLYWVNTGGTYWQIQSLDLATGRIASLGFGMAVFASPDGRQVFIAQTGESLLEFPAAGGRSRSLKLPSGWFVAGLNDDFTSPAAVAGGVLVQASDSIRAARPTKLAVWNPDNGRLTLISSGVSANGGLLGTVTPPGANYSLIAWWRGSCYPSSCAIEITNTATRLTRILRSPLGHGFAYGVAFSPDGDKLAAFANTFSISTTPAPAELAILSTRTGAARLVPRVSLLMGQDIAWARWLPGGNMLLVGGGLFSGVVNPETLTVRPYFFVHGRDHYIEDSQDVNYSAVVIRR
jgi:hypothetical protein